MAARALKVTSPIGKDLDSLADMVTFGVVPGVVMYRIMTTSCNNDSFYNMQNEMANGGSVGLFLNSNAFLDFWPVIAFIIPVFSAIRLAKFNNDTRQTESFIGLPTPANAIFICSFPLIVNNISFDVTDSIKWVNSGFYGFSEFMLNRVFLIITSIACSSLLIAPLPLFALKFKSFRWKGNEIRFVFLGLSSGLLITLKFVGVPLIIILYILLSVMNNLLNKKSSPFLNNERET